MTFEEVLTEFRTAGGTAENICLGHGQLGRGLFPIDPAQPATVFAPRSLMVPIDAIEIRDGALQAQPGAVGEDAARLFADYQRYFGWSAGGREAIWAQQTQWHELPKEIAAAIEALGVLDQPGRRFAAPTIESCLFEFLQARYFGQTRPSIAPVVDMVNFSSNANPYLSEGGFGVSGTFSGEMLVRYNLVDSFALILTYGFTVPTHFAFSVGITVDLPSGLRLSVKRDTEECESRGGVAFPLVAREGNVIHFSHLKLGNRTAPDLPRGIFRAAMAPFVDREQADGVFDMIAQFNRTRFLNLLRLTRRFDGPLVRQLEEACFNQLETLSSCMGARAL